MRTWKWIVVPLLVFPLAGMAEEGTTTRSDLHRCHVPGLSTQVLCGTFSVPANGEDASGGRFELEFTLLPARPDQSTENAVLVLAGGPGRTARNLVGPVSRLLGETAPRRDILFIDQRGTGDSRPLDCPAPPRAMDLSDVKAYVAACLSGSGFDASHFTSRLTIEDFEDLRRSLSYEQWDLLALSYGTRLAQIYMREYPRNVRSAVLSGVVPLDVAIGARMGMNAQRALNALFSRCKSQDDCRAAFPNLDTRFDAWLTDLASDPVEVSFRHPRTGEVIERTIGRRHAASLVRKLLYDSRTQRILPLILHKAIEGNFKPLMGVGQLLKEDVATAKLSFAITANRMCNKDIGRYGLSAVLSEEAESFLGLTLVRFWLSVCEVWPRYDVPDDYDQPLESDIPVLLVSGENDPVTPPGYGRHLAKSLNRSRHVIIPGGAHNALFQGRCPASIVNNFLENPRPEVLGTECIERQHAAPLFSRMTGFRVESSDPDWQEDGGHD